MSWMDRYKERLQRSRSQMGRDILVRGREILVDIQTAGIQCKLQHYIHSVRGGVQVFWNSRVHVKL